MHIDLNDEYAVEYDGLCFQLLAKRVIKAREEGARGIAPKPENIGKTATSVVGYYGTLTQAIQAYLQKEIGKSEMDTFEAVMDYLDTSMARFDAVFDKVDPVIRQAYKEAREAQEVPSVQA
jgi:hypothetical protein